MSAYFPTFAPALRTVDSVGNVIRGPHALTPQAGVTDGLTGLINGVLLARGAAVTYATEIYGPFTYTNYDEAPSLIGFRALVELEFSLIGMNSAWAPGTQGFGLLLAYYLDAFTSDQYAALQFNLYRQSGTWRGVYPTSSWNPKPAGDKQPSGYFEMTMSLRARSLIAAPGDFSAFEW